MVLRHREPVRADVNSFKVGRAGGRASGRAEKQSGVRHRRTRMMEVSARQGVELVVMLMTVNISRVDVAQDSTQS